MRAHRLPLPLPLLTRELADQAGRRRTYVLRMAYAAALSVGFCVASFHVWQALDPIGLPAVGSGQRMFEFLVAAQFGAVCLLLPLLMCSAVTGEKERGTLALLLVSDLSDGQIVLQKYASRLVPALTFLLASLPSQALCYAFGGLSPDRLAAGCAMLAATCLQVGALSLFCSVYFRRTASALVASYVGQALVFFLLPASCLALRSVGLFPWASAREMLGVLFPLQHYYSAAEQGWAAMILNPFIALSTVAPLLMARDFLRPRACAPVEARARGPLGAGRGRPLPGGEPIAWLEAVRRGLGRRRSTLKAMALINVPVLIFALGAGKMESGRREAETLTGLGGLLALPMGLMIVAVSAALFSGERQRRTLDVLLAAPLTGREIVRQKMHGVRRLMLVMGTALLTVCAVEACVERYPGNEEFALYIVCSVIGAAVYMPMLAWTSVWVGLRSRSTARAVMGAVGLQAALVVVPSVAALSMMAARAPLPAAAYLTLTNPLTMVVISEGHAWGSFFDQPVLAVALNFVWHGGVVLLFRRMCLQQADRLMGRIEGSDDPPPPSPAARAVAWAVDGQGRVLVAALVALAAFMVGFLPVLRRPAISHAALTGNVLVLLWSASVVLVAARSTRRGPALRFGQGLWVALFAVALVFGLTQRMPPRPGAVRSVCVAAMMNIVFVVLYLRIVAWGAACAGRKVSDRPAATVLTVAAAVAWCLALAGLMTALGVTVTGRVDSRLGDWLRLLTPIRGGMVADWLRWRRADAATVAALTLNFLLHLVILIALRGWRLKQLRRAAETA